MPRGAKKSRAKKKPACQVEAPKQLYQSAIVPEYDDWVSLEVKMMSWSFVNFSLQLRTQEPLSKIARMVEERHGGIGDLCFFTSPTKPRYTAAEFHFPLSKIGIQGAEKSANASAVLYFDFKTSHDDPLLLLEPDLSRVDSDSGSEANSDIDS